MTFTMTAEYVISPVTDSDAGLMQFRQMVLFWRPKPVQAAFVFSLSSVRLHLSLGLTMIDGPSTAAVEIIRLLNTWPLTSAHPATCVIQTGHFGSATPDRDYHGTVQ